MVIFLFEIFYASENDRLISVYRFFFFNQLHICAYINKNSLFVDFWIDKFIM